MRESMVRAGRYLGRMQSIYPVLKYDDAHAAIDFLERAFGFERHAVYDGENGGVGHAELRFGDRLARVLRPRSRGQPLVVRDLPPGDGANRQLNSGG